ncbi:MAG: mitochondrial fission ELM1 family protein [Candidatus Paracaedibacteraceae bacterium]|nr:mitochondrial fission ELM1 family protein [Candidatus Paracaedibacteraceae bacterium]
MTTCWVISDGSAGMINQAWGLAESLGFEVTLRKIKLRQPWESLAPYFRCGLNFCLSSTSDSLNAPYPDIVFASGRRATLPALLIKQKSPSTKIVYFQNPKISSEHFDAVICPEHDNYIGANVITTLGATHRITDEKLKIAAQHFAYLNPDHRPVLSVIIGGPNKNYSMPDDFAERLSHDLNQLLNQGWRILITLSRRTPLTIAEKLKQLPDSIYIWDGKGNNPYFGLLGLANVLLVTCDSISMISEACATSAQVYLYKLDGTYPKFDHFHTSVINSGRAEWWTGNIISGDVIPLTVTQDTATKLKELLCF